MVAGFNIARLKEEGRWEEGRKMRRELKGEKEREEASLRRRFTQWVL